VSANPATSRSSSIAAELQRLRHGDPAAADPIARRACTLALRTAATIMHSRAEASDVAQDVAEVIAFDA
jgi:hypothetical protein